MVFDFWPKFRPLVNRGQNWKNLKIGLFGQTATRFGRIGNRFKFAGFSGVVRPIARSPVPELNFRPG